MDHELIKCARFPMIETVNVVEDWTYLVYMVLPHHQQHMIAEMYHQMTIF